MTVRVLPKACGDLRETIGHYSAVKPSAIGKQIASRVLETFKQAIASVEGRPLSRPEHPDIAGARWVLSESPAPSGGIQVPVIKNTSAAGSPSATSIRRGLRGWPQSSRLGCS
jgi:hypothetical protein